MAEFDPLDCTSPQYSGPLIITRPLQEMGDEDHIVAYQKFYVTAGDYAAAVLNSVLSYGSEELYCVGDTEPSPEEAGLVSYERRWANVPTDRTEPETYVATHPGIANQRESFTRSCTSTLLIEYFLVGPGETYATADAIPTVSAETYSYSGDDLPRSPDGFFLSGSTTPTKAAYITKVSTGDYDVIAEDSSLARYMGNIYARTTRSVKAQ